MKIEMLAEIAAAGGAGSESESEIELDADLVDSDYSAAKTKLEPDSEAVELKTSVLVTVVSRMMRIPLAFPTIVPMPTRQQKKNKNITTLGGRKEHQ